MNSNACLSSQLDLFVLPGTQMSQEKNGYVPHYPISALDDGPIEFDIKPSPQYTDLNDTRLYIRANIKTTTGEMPGDDTVAPVNMLLHAMFNKVDVYVGDRMITQSSGTYQWKAVIKTLLNFGPDAKQSHLQTIMYHKDTATEMDSTDSTSVLGGNLGLKERRKRTANCTFELFGPLHVDFFFQAKYMLDRVPIRVKLHRSRP
jgi:hypothetical protein